MDGGDTGKKQIDAQRQRSQESRHEQVSVHLLALICGHCVRPPHSRSVHGIRCVEVVKHTGGWLRIPRRHVRLHQMVKGRVSVIISARDEHRWDRCLLQKINFWPAE
jgi:hypothetical protein